MTTEITSTPIGGGDPKVPFNTAAPFVFLSGFVNVALAILLFNRGANVVGAVLAVALPLGALTLVYQMVRDGGFRTSRQFVSAQDTPRQYWLTVGTLTGLYVVATIMLLVLFAARYR